MLGKVLFYGAQNLFKMMITVGHAIVCVLTNMCGDPWPHCSDIGHWIYHHPVLHYQPHCAAASWASVEGLRWDKETYKYIQKNRSISDFDLMSIKLTQFSDLGSGISSSIFETILWMSFFPNNNQQQPQHRIRGRRDHAVHVPPPYDEAGQGQEAIYMQNFHNLINLFATIFISGVVIYFRYLFSDMVKVLCAMNILSLRD